MHTLLKEIRTCLDMSQAKLADRLNVTFATVNRWENAHSVPSKSAQARICALCREKDVPVYDMILGKIQRTAKDLPLDEHRLLLYHGSKSGIKGKIKPTSRPFCDFGRGFYMGTDPGQALTLICDFEESLFYLVSIDLSLLDIAEIPANIDWAMTVAYHRGKMEEIKGTPLYNRYSSMTQRKDLIIGSIADDRMFYVIDNFFHGTITDAALVGSLSALQLGKQYAAVSQKGCDAIRIEHEMKLSYLERIVIKEVAAANREKGITLADTICRSHRRDGKFFDELLAEARQGGTL